MRKIIFLLLWLTILLKTNPASGQWCSVTTAIPYGTEMPGITNFKCNTIDRSSLSIENYPSNSYVLATQTTTLYRGVTYMATITHTRDSVFFPAAHENLRVWIDFNQDGQLDDPGETVLSLQDRSYGTDSMQFTIPLSATLGLTRMRVTAKMAADGGHTDPTPCDNPPDPFQYHGEIEDYSITIADSATGIHDFNENNFAVKGSVLDGECKFQIVSTGGNCKISVYDLLGKERGKIEFKILEAGEQQVVFAKEKLGISGKGLYFVRIDHLAQTKVVKLWNP